MTRRRSRTRIAPTVAAVSALPLALALASCSGSGDDAAADATTAPAATTSVEASARSTDLAARCPATIVVLTGSGPQAELGGLYQLLGPDPTIDPGNHRVQGRVYVDGAPAGPALEIRSWGPGIGFQSVSQQLYDDTGITLGWVDTDDAIRNSEKLPTTAVFAPFEKAPWAIMWDPQTYPDATTIADVGETSAVVRYAKGAAYMDYLVGSGLLKQSQVDDGYDGTPAAFVAAGGKDAQQAFASNEPYLYQHELPSWNKAVTTQLVADTGYPLYAGALSVRTADLPALSECLTAFVPLIQQATVDYFESPDATDALIVEAAKQLTPDANYSSDRAADSVARQIELGLVGNGDDATLGNFDAARVQTVLDLTSPIFTKNGTPPRAGLAASDLFTNEFVDPSIGLE